MASLFKELAYIVIDEGDVEAWSGFGTQLLGLEVQRHRSVLTMKMDLSPPRYFVLKRKSKSSFPPLGWMAAYAETQAVIDGRLRYIAIHSLPHAAAAVRFREAAGGLGFVFHIAI